MAAKNADPLSNPLSVEMGAQSWTNTCGVCHVGGGQMEYNRELEAYGTAGEGPGDTYVLKYARLDDASTASVDETSWDNVEAGWLDASNKAEMDCLMCHLDGSNAGSAWLKTLDCSATNPIGPLTDPTCSGTPMYPGSRTVEWSDGVNDYDMYNRNFALKQRRNDLLASMGAGAKGVFTGTDLTGVDWGSTAVETAADLTGLIGTCVTEDVAYNSAGCATYEYQAFTGGTCEGDYVNKYEITAASSDCIKLDGDRIAFTPKSENCSVCHARDDNTIGLPGMITMKTGFGNYGLIHDPSNSMTSGNMGADSDLDTDNGANSANDDYWFDFGCKTGMGKRAHKIGDAGDYIGPNARYGMSMFIGSTLDMDPTTVPNAGDPVPGKMPDVDMHDAAGMQCATCHYSLGSDRAEGYIDIPATTSHGFDYPAERIYAMDHQFAQADSMPDTKGKNNLDAMLQCGVCHIERTHPNLSENGGDLLAPTPTHAGLPQVHIDLIGCVTCHVPETYSAPGRLKYRDWTAGFARGTFRNQLDWNFNLVEGNHNTVPTLRKWATKNGETKIYPFLPSLLPTWYEMIPNSGILAVVTAPGVDGILGTADDVVTTTEKNDAGMAEDDNLFDTVAEVGSYASPVKNRDLQRVGEYVRDQNQGLAALPFADDGAGNDLNAGLHGFDMRLNGGNTVPLFDGFQIVDSWEIDTLQEIDAMLDAFGTTPGVANPATGADARYASFLNVIQADFDVTHGIVPKEWALGGSERGGCVSCHSSRKQVVSVDPSDPANFMVPNPNYSPYSIGFFEGYTQPVDNAGLPNFGVGGADVVKNWMALFADFDVTAMCGMNNPALMTDDGMNGMLSPGTTHHNYYFNPLTGAPIAGQLCDANSWFSSNFMLGTAGWCADVGSGSVDTCMYDFDGDGTPDTPGGPCTDDNAGSFGTGVMGTDSACDQTATIEVGIGMMTNTFDAAMGFPSGTAAQMGMYDGVAGIQGFALKELQTQGTLGCNGFAGPASSPVAQATGNNVNNCMPNYMDPGVQASPLLNGMAASMGMTLNDFAGLISGWGCYDNGDHTTGTAGPGTCDLGFRGGQPCADANDCFGAMTDVAEVEHNPFGLIMNRPTAKSHFKIDLEQGFKTPGDASTPKVKWSAGGDQNPNNPAHMNKWDQAQYCYDYSTAVNPMMPDVVACVSLGAGGSDGSGRKLIATAQSANQFLGYTPAKLAELMVNPITDGDNNYNGGAHVTHSRAGISCTDCHTSNTDFVMTDGMSGTVGADTWAYSAIISADGCNEWAIDNTDGITGTADDYVCVDVVAGAATGYGTCNATCHPNTTTPGTTAGDGNGEFSTAFLSTLSANRVGDLDNTVTIDATRSTCDSGDCTITVDHSAGAPTVIGGTGPDNIVVQYAAPGSYLVSVTVADNINPGVNATASALAVAAIVEDASNQGSVVVVDNGNGTCTVTSADVDNAVRAKIYWGDRTSTNVSDPAAELAAPGITHSCGTTVRVKMIDADHLATNM